MTDNLALIKEDIAMARAWLEKRFPPKMEGPILYTGFDIEYPEPDQATVWPLVLGERMDIAEVTFRLCWQHRAIYWKGNFEMRKQVFGEENVIEHRIGPAKGCP